VPSDAKQEVGISRRRNVWFRSVKVNAQFCSVALVQVPFIQGTDRVDHETLRVALSARSPCRASDETRSATCRCPARLLSNSIPRNNKQRLTPANAPYAGCHERDRKIADLQAKVIGANASGQSSKHAGSKTELQSAQPVLLAPARDRRAPRMNANGR
jgi:hypothetical protein